ncbi:MAG: hypothetical protein WCP21_07345 [Armatimonadota bacterium]
MFVAALCLAAVLLFLNYRPRYPLAFSSYYGQSFPRREMVDAICRLRGEDVRGQLQFYQSSEHGVAATSEFRVPATGEKFRVSEVRRKVESWDLGSYVPQLGLPTAPTEAYHHAFMRRYCPWVDGKRMHAAIRTTYMERIAGGMLSELRRCSFSWDKTRKHLLSVYFVNEPLRATPRPTINRAEAEQLALQRAHKTFGLLSATVGGAFYKRDPTYGDAALVSLDELGVQRCIYAVRVEKLTWQRWAHPLNSYVCDSVPTGDVLLVDAETGAAFPISTLAFWEHGVFARRLELSLPGHSLTFIVYPAIRLWGQPYLCGKYLQSYLWQGQYSFDRRSGVFTVEDQGRRWTGRRGSPFLLGPEGLSMTWRPARMIDGELYLPTPMIARITGWSLKSDWWGLTLRPPE